MTGYEPYASLALAAAAGLLIGLERERMRPPEESKRSFLGGARTYPLLALAGGVATLAAREIGVVAIAIPFVALVVLLALAYAGDVLRERHRGITSETAFVLTFLLGVLSLTQGVLEGTQKIFVVSSIAIVVTFLLSAKPTLHPLVQKIAPEDVAATLKFLVVAVVVLPLLPNRTFGPLDVLNPYHVGLLVVLISALSFAGYAAIRLLGARRGMGVTGLVGGLVSSTAVTLSMAARARERPEIADSAALAVMLASTIMFARVFLIVAVVAPALAPSVAWPMAAGVLGGAGTSALLWLRSGKAHARQEAIVFSNPFELGSAVGFALLFAVILVGSKAASVYLGTAGTYAAGLLAGSTDVDAITLSMARIFAGNGLSAEVAATTIFLGTASNTAVKGVMAAVAGGWGFGRRVIGAQLAVLVAGALGAVAAWL